MIAKELRGFTLEDLKKKSKELVEELFNTPEQHDGRDALEHAAQNDEGHNRDEQEHRHTAGAARPWWRPGCWRSPTG